jgi:dTDP-4-amino-4,6-dideoxygalactose transaminase
MGRIYLSPPHMTDVERGLLLDAFDGNWVAPVGPDLDAFETEFADRVGVEHAVGLTSGTAGLHLALLVSDVRAGDVVIVPSFTFAATANAVCYVGAEPWFVDSESATWNVDPDLINEAIAAARRAGRRVGAVITVDLYGQCANHEPIRAACQEGDIPLIEDAAEAVGATWQGAAAGSFGDIGVFSFNGNKAMTTGGGGMAVSSDAAVIERIRHLSTQAREPALHYEHTEVGFNYRLSNVLAAIGRGQVRRLSEMLARRAEIRARYEAALGPLAGVSFNPLDPRGRANNWLTVIVLGDDARASPGRFIDALEAVDAEARPAWKPMHRQPVFASARMFGGEVADAAFARGVCLPSGSSISDDDLSRVIDAATAVLS